MPPIAAANPLMRSAQPSIRMLSDPWFKKLLAETPATAKLVPVRKIKFRIRVKSGCE